jgi:hypothetical protein
MPHHSWHVNLSAADNRRVESVELKSVLRNALVGVDRLAGGPV